MWVAFVCRKKLINHIVRYLVSAIKFKLKIYIEYDLF